MAIDQNQNTQAVQLPTQKTPAKSDIRDFVTLIYGQPKIGKSTFCAAADGALFIATEPGLNHLEVYQVPVKTWREFLEVCSLLAKGDHQFRTVVIDTVDNLYKFCTDFVLNKHGLQHQSDLDYGKGYDLINTEFSKRLTALSLLPYGLMMTSHAQEKEVKTRTGKETKITLTLPNSARKIVLGMADYILYAEIQEIRDDQGVIVGYERVLHTQPTTIYEAGNRTQYELPDTLPLSYQVFTDAIKESVKRKLGQTAGGSGEVQSTSPFQVVCGGNEKLNADARDDQAIPSTDTPTVGGDGDDPFATSVPADVPTANVDQPSVEVKTDQPKPPSARASTSRVSSSNASRVTSRGR